jgi:hypothetical protein
VKYALERSPELRQVLRGWVATWQSGTDEAVGGLAGLFEQAPKPIKASEVIAAVKAQRETYHASCGL